MRITKDQRDAWRQNTADSLFNVWLSAQITGPDGGLDLARLDYLAKQYGIDKEQAFAHLNPGQQRMNIGNMLRARVPRTLYETPIRDGTGEESGPSPRHDVVRSASVRELLSLHAEILDELRERKIVRTANSPLGDYAELLFATAFGWRLNGNSSAGFDAVDEQGVRYQIKSRRVTAKNPSRQLSFIRRLPDRTFDILACVLFDSSYRVLKALMLPHEAVSTLAKYVEHTNGWRFMADDRAWLAEGARDVTMEIIRTAETI